MNYGKRILAMILSGTLLLGCFSLPAYADGSISNIAVEETTEENVSMKAVQETSTEENAANMISSERMTEAIVSETASEETSAAAGETSAEETSAAAVETASEKTSAAAGETSAEETSAAAGETSAEETSAAAGEIASEETSAAAGETVFEKAALETERETTSAKTVLPENALSLLSLEAEPETRMQTVKVKVVWETDGSEMEKKERPDSVNMTLEYTTDGTVWQEYETDTVRVVSGNGDVWEAEWELPAENEEGEELSFRVSQHELNVYDTTYKKKENAAGDSRVSEWTVTNTYSDAWNYSIDLSWDNADPVKKYYQDDVTLDIAKRTLKYQLTISANDNYEAGKLEVRLPYSIWKDRKGRAIVPTSQQISVPKVPLTNPEYAFSYWIDDHGTTDLADDEIVFVNHDSIQTGFKQTLTVGYTVDPIQTIDCSRTDLTATGYGLRGSQTNQEVQVSNTIHYQIDTGAQIRAFTKVTYPRGKESDKQGRLYAWDSSLGEKPEDFDPEHFNYVAYSLYAKIERNQPYQLELTENPDKGGKVVSILSNRAVDSNDYNWGLSYDENSSTWKSGIVSLSGLNYTQHDMEYLIVVAYPRVEGEEVIEYTNTAELSCLAADEHEGDKGENDQNDISAEEAKVSSFWEDYEYSAPPGYFSLRKSMSGFDSAGLTLLENGLDVKTSYTVTAEMADYEKSFSFSLDDDAVYAYARINNANTDRVRLTEADYEFCSVKYSSGDCVSIRIVYDTISKTDGTTIKDPAQIPDEPFVFWGKKSKDGEWEKIYELTNVKTEVFSQVPAELVNDKGYVAFRVTAPEGLIGRFNVQLGAGIKIKASSPLVQQWIAEKPDYINIINFAAFRLYQEDENGNYVWVNPLDEQQLTPANQCGLSEEDALQENGKYPWRATANRSVYPVSTDSSIYKVMQQRGIENNTAKSEAYVPFTILEVETIGSSKLPEEVYKNFSQDSGVFYDLLPLGYHFNPDKPVTVRGHYYGNADSADSSFYSKDNAKLASPVEVIDNYRGSGRQMVIFRVRTTEEPGKNVYPGGTTPYATGFRVDFTATISWTEYSFFSTGYNLAAFQRGDNKEFGGQYTAWTEQGYPYKVQETKIWENDDQGVPLMYDPDNDGVIEGKNTMYAYAYTAPEIYTTIQSGIYKTVKGISGIYQLNDYTDISQEYSYKVQLTTSDGGTTSDVILVDILENAANIDGGTGESGWKGTFAGVDTKIPEKQGIDVKVYYSTVQGLSYNDEAKMKLDSGVWTQEAPEDLSLVTAVAFDLGTGVDGNPHIFGSHQSTYVEIRMKAPAEIPEEVYAYNRPAYWSTFLVNGGQVPQTVFNNGNRTTIALRRSISVSKTWSGEKNTESRPATLTFELYRNGTLYETAVFDTTKTTEKLFKDLYIFDEDGAYYHYEVREQAVTGYEAQSSSIQAADTANPVTVTFENVKIEEPTPEETTTAEETTTVEETMTAEETTTAEEPTEEESTEEETTAIETTEEPTPEETTAIETTEEPTPEETTAEETTEEPTPEETTAEETTEEPTPEETTTEETTEETTAEETTESESTAEGRIVKETTPEETTLAETTPAETTASQNSPKGPVTGDNQPVRTFLILMFGSLTALLFAAARSRKIA